MTRIIKQKGGISRKYGIITRQLTNNFLTIDNLSRHCQCKHQEVGNDGGKELHGGGGNGKDLLLLIVE
jgi:hypothetical protein